MHETRQPPSAPEPLPPANATPRGSLDAATWRSHGVSARESCNTKAHTSHAATGQARPCLPRHPCRDRHRRVAPRDLPLGIHPRAAPHAGCQSHPPRPLLYRSGLVPRILPTLGLVGAPVHITAVVLTMFGVFDRIGTVAGVAVIPVAAWELWLGIYLVTKGFRPAPIVATPVPPAPPASPARAVSPALPLG
ncbi:DUF4386 domain-containing protein [Phycicoccus sp. SLBN-51]|uniref:DUF4386 domain-containing protein n=1 Tax=Phycicoccus sp. SLBN-51 TaxID=2768447 RepID=UPI0011505384|nr:DUF4386 domain-containing protein [Phycicoccus sp. SLBN-51]